MVNQALREMRHDFGAMYAKEGRPCLPPEKLLRALLLQALYTIRNERLLMEQLDYNLLFRWFVGLVHGRQGLEPFRLFQESGTISGFGLGRGLFRADPGARGSSRTAVGRAFLSTIGNKMSKRLKIIIAFDGHNSPENILWSNMPLSHFGFSTAC
jgi:hypothetical protein